MPEPSQLPTAIARRIEPQPERYEPGVHREGQLVAGKYCLQSLIGQGGMGTVWMARNEALESRVAIKLIRSDLERGQVADRLLIEARAAASLDHPGVVRIFDFGETEQGDPYIVMELLDGYGFDQLLKQHGALVPERAVQTLLPIVDALRFAHQKGVVHRDLKPENILLVKQVQRLQPKLVDFGIAKTQFGTDRHATDGGTIIGSPGYMSPEQACGYGDVDGRADVWSLCVVLYESLTGRLPFEGDNYNAILRAIVEDQPEPIAQHEPGDDDLWHIIERGLEKDRDRRWQSMSALGQALAHWLLSRGVGCEITGDSLAHWWKGSHDGSEDRNVFTTRPPVSGSAKALWQAASQPTDFAGRTERSSTPAGTSITAAPLLARRLARRSLPWLATAAAVAAAALFVVSSEAPLPTAPAGPALRAEDRAGANPNEGRAQEPASEPALPLAPPPRPSDPSAAPQASPAARPLEDAPVVAAPSAESEPRTRRRSRSTEPRSRASTAATRPSAFPKTREPPRPSPVPKAQAARSPFRPLPRSAAAMDASQGRGSKQEASTVRAPEPHLALKDPYE